MRRARSATILGGAIVGVAALVWAPSLIADHYADGPGGADGVLGHPQMGWSFLRDAVVESRGARLGSPTSALERAREVWSGPPATARTVALTWTTGTMALPAADGTTARVRPASPFSWIVRGRARGADDTVIGVLDHGSGRVVWSTGRTGTVRR
jgi:hypothetical protein